MSTNHYRPDLPWRRTRHALDQARDAIRWALDALAPKATP